MSPTLSNLMRVTGMGRVPAEVFLRTCAEAELVLIEAGDVQAGLDAKAVRESTADDPTDLIEPLNAGTPSGPSPAESESESFPADEAEE